MHSFQGNFLELRFAIDPHSPAKYHGQSTYPHVRYPHEK